METRDVLVPHDPARGPLVAVRRMLVHSSIAGLQELGLYEQYARIMHPTSLATIHELIGPGWMPKELALEHYDACDKLRLSDDRICEIGARTGGAMGDALLVAATQVAGHAGPPSVWAIVGAFSRMGRRIYEGSSAQYVKVGPNKLLIEYTGNPLFSVGYYRVAHGAFLRRTFASVGVEVTDVVVSPYRPKGAEIDTRLVFKQ